MSTIKIEGCKNVQDVAETLTAEDSVLWQVVCEIFNTLEDPDAMQSMIDTLEKALAWETLDEWDKNRLSKLFDHYQEDEAGVTAIVEKYYKSFKIPQVNSDGIIDNEFQRKFWFKRDATGKLKFTLKNFFDKFINPQEWIDEETKSTRNKRFENQKNQKLTEKDKEKLFGINYRYDAQKNIHYIDDKTLFVPKYSDYTLADYKKDGKYSFENIKENEKFKKSTKETGLPYMDTDKIYEIFWSIAKTLWINDTIDIEFFRNESENSIKLMQAFRMITWFEGRIPLSMTTDGNYARVECLVCFGDLCWFYSDRYYDYDDFSPFQGW